MDARLTASMGEESLGGYAEAVAGQERACQGLASFHESADWDVVGPAYRHVLLATAGRAGRRTRWRWTARR